MSSGSIQEGYSTIDEGLWVCPQCYEDFKNYYDMPLIPNNVTMVETGLNEGKTVTFSLNNERYILKKTDEKIKLYLIFMAWHVNILNTDDT